MGLYDNAWSSSYEEIKRFYPVWYWDVSEMDAVWKTEGYELDNVRFSIERTLDNSFILSAEEGIVSLFESFLDLHPDSSLSLDERKKVILSLLFPTPHIGAPEIRAIFRIYTNGEITLSLIGGAIHITINRIDEGPLNILAIQDVLKRRIPAHLGLDFTDILTYSPVDAPVYVGCATAFQFSRDKVVVS